MKTARQLALLLVCALTFLSVGAQTAQPTAKSAPAVPPSWKQIPIPALKPFHPQEPRRVELQNGMVIFLQADHELPMIDGTIRIRGGRRDEPAGKTGLSAIYSETWRTGGTKSRTGDELDDFLETRAAQVETSSGTDSTFLSWSSPKEVFDPVFAVVVDLLENPEFRQEKITLARNQLKSAIARRNDDINAIAQRESTKLAYGADSPYARTAEYATIAAVTRDDLVEWHKRTVAPNNVILGIVGDFDPAQMENKLRAAFGTLPQGTRLQTAPIAFHPAQGLFLIEKNDVNQSDISMVGLGIERRNPDYYAVEVFNQLFGGSFTSRLVANIRTKLGLAYSIGGGIGAAYDHPGIFRIALGTKSDSTAAALEALNQQLANISKGGIKESELRTAKDAILNSFVFAFDSKEKVLAERMAYEFYGYPEDFLERYRAGIEKVTVAQVNEVATKYVHPEGMAVLVVGNAKEFDRDLSTFGKVTKIDITIPTAGQQN